MGFGGDRSRLTHQLQFVGLSEQPRLVEEFARVEIRSRTNSGSRTQSLAMAHDLDHPEIHRLVVAQHVVVGALDVLEISRQYAIELVDEKRLVGAKPAYRSLDPGAPPGPGLALLVT